MRIIGGRQSWLRMPERLSRPAPMELANKRSVPGTAPVQKRGGPGGGDGVELLPRTCRHLNDLRTQPRGVCGPPDKAGRGRLETKSSIVLIVCRVSLTIHDLTVLRDRHVDARTAFGVGKFDGLRHIVGIFPTMIHGFKVKATTVHLRVLRPPLGR
jgi:hypothetical protein